jgi:FAD/FMN-containing dehydrogenase
MTGAANLSGWGRFPTAACTVATPRSEAELSRCLAQGDAIARGAGRAYGDSAMAPGRTIDMRHFNRMIAFDPASGRLVAEAGVTLADVIAAFLPRGWFTPVTPGTKFVTLGGMVAADVHGKNHHRVGSFGRFVDWIDVMGPDGRVVRACATHSPDLFAWTLGGMGLTGVILRIAFRLMRIETGWIRQRTVPAQDLDTAIATFEAAQDSTYSVAWIDCLAAGAALGRSVLLLGEHALVDELPPARRERPFAVPRRRRVTIPIDAPSWLLSRPVVRAFNAAYWRRHAARAGEGLVDWDAYFYPLDAIAGWNRLYGRRGFLQFQCVLPLEASAQGLRSLLSAIAAEGAASFLAVLKRLGSAAGGISFAMPGYTLALDFPVSAGSLRLLERLDAITVDHGGRFYLAKDARMTDETLRRADPRVGAFAAMRSASGAARHFASLQSRRLGL